MRTQQHWDADGCERDVLLCSAPAAVFAAALATAAIRTPAATLATFATGVASATVSSFATSIAAPAWLYHDNRVG